MVLVSLIPDVIYQNLLKLPVDDRDVLLVVLCFIVIVGLKDIVGGEVEEEAEIFKGHLDHCGGRQKLRSS